jgi:ribosome maturation factor RimP
VQLARFFHFLDMTLPVQQSVVDRVREISEPIIGALGLELVDLEYLRQGPRIVLRFFIDREGGVTLEHCQAVSHALGPLLDVEEVVDSAYALEVSSPGLDRPLKKPADFEKYQGKQVHIRTYAPITSGVFQGRKKFSGTLLGLAGTGVEIEVDGQRGAIPLQAISKAHLIYEF